LIIFAREIKSKGWKNLKLELFKGIRPNLWVAQFELYLYTAQFELLVHNSIEVRCE